MQAYYLWNYEQARPATTSAYTAACVLQMVPADADLIVIEFSFNDYEHGGAYVQPDHDTRQAFLSPQQLIPCTIWFTRCKTYPLSALQEGLGTHIAQAVASGQQTGSALLPLLACHAIRALLGRRGRLVRPLTSHLTACFDSAIQH